MHRTSPKSRSLSVQRETLRVLASSELQSVGGGESFARAHSILNINCLEIPPDFRVPGVSGAGRCGPTGPIFDIPSIVIVQP